MRNEPLILIAEDDENDVLLLRRALETAKVFARLSVVRNGQEAIDYLSGHGNYVDRVAHPWPAVMLLDLKMPMVDGFDVLTWWRDQRGERELPIVVLSSSVLESDTERALSLGAAAYRVKATGFEHLVTVAEELRERWLKPNNAVP
jgi:two-component system response regulator